MADDDIWMITAVIQPFKLDAVVLALQDLEEPVGLTVSDCRGFGQSRSMGSEANSRIRSVEGDDVVDFSPKTRLEIALSGGDRVAHVSRLIANAARTGRKGDGKIFITRLTDAIRIRNSDVGRNAL